MLRNLHKDVFLTTPVDNGAPMAPVPTGNTALKWLQDIVVSLFRQKIISSIIIGYIFEHHYFKTIPYIYFFS